MVKSTHNLFEQPRPSMLARHCDPHTSQLNAGEVAMSKNHGHFNQRILNVLRSSSGDMTAKEIAYVINPENWLQTYMQVWKKMFLLVKCNEIEVSCERKSKIHNNHRIVQAYRIKTQGGESRGPEN
jgi:hypothetical protein